MATPKSKLAAVDPVWNQIKYDAEKAVAAEPLIGGFVHATILHHGSIEKALSYRVAAKLSSNEMSMMVVREIVDQAYAEDPSLVNAARADLVAIYDRDPACHRLLQPILYFKGYQAVQAYRVGHFLWRRGQLDLAYFFQMRVSEFSAWTFIPARGLARAS